MGSSDSGVMRIDPRRMEVPDTSGDLMLELANKRKFIRENESDWDIDGVRRSDRFFSNRDTEPVAATGGGNVAYTAIAEGPDGRPVFDANRNMFDGSFDMMVEMLRSIDADPDPSVEDIQYANEVRELLRRRTGM